MNHSTPLLPDVMDQMRCFGCGEAKPISKFRFRPETGKRRGNCDECRYRDKRRYYYAANHPPLTEGEKECGGCERVLPLTRFRPYRALIDGRSSWCLHCEKSGALRRRTGATLDWKAIKFALQLGLCTACGKGEPWGGRWDESVVDHIEVEGVKVPVGVLHSDCNQSIGKANHDPAVTDGWSAYLRATR